MAVGTNYYIRVLLSAFVYPAGMPRQWCAHLWGCLWGIGGCYPSRTPSLVLAPGWWPGGLIPYLKDVWYRYRGVQPDGDRDCFSHIFSHIFLHILQGGGSLLRPPAHVRATGLSGLGACRPTGAPVSHPSLHPRTHPAHPSRSRRSVEAPVRGPPLVRMSRGRPPMRGPGQPERWAGSGSVVGQGRQQGALIGGGAWGGHRGARRGGSGGG